MQITLLTSSFPRHADDDAGIFIARLAQAYSKVGHSGFIVVPRDADEPLDANFEGFIVKRFAYGIFSKGALAFGAGMMPNLRRNPALIFQAPGLVWQMARTALRNTQNISIIHANWTLPLLAAFLVHTRSKLPYIATVRGEDLRLLQNPFARAILRPAYERAQAITSVNEEFCTQLKSYFPRKAASIFFIPNGVELQSTTAQEKEAFASKYKLPPKKLLLFLGTLIPRKAVEVLIEALKIPALSDFHLALCGRAEDALYLERLRGIAADVKQRVHFTGPIAPREVPAALGAASYYVTASQFEGRPNSVLEALAAGKIVLASSIKEHAEIIKDGANGFLFECAATLAERIAELECNQDRRSEVAREAVASVQGYSWIACAEAYSGLLNAAH
ncbi:MAG: glycosyltransferase family 4 protein [Oligoflexia bacterium]|nr:glycosyltransferase family 4 protein [Oligoflexia bacterium]